MADTTNELVPSVSIDNLLKKREAMIERVREAQRLLGEVQDLASIFYPDAEHCSYRLSLEFSRTRREFTVEAMVKELDTHAWGYLLERSGMQTFLDSAARDKWRKAIDSMDVPPLTRENIQATFRTLYDTRGEMFERGVLEVFRKLSWDYKTNSHRMFGKRLVLGYIVEGWGRSGRSRYLSGVSHSGADKLDDLIRVLSVLDSKPEPDIRQGVWRRLHDLKWMRAEGPRDADLGYFTIRGFKNGNGHLTFTRPDLVDKLNQILAKHHPHALPPDETAQP